MRAVECTLTQKVGKVALSLLRGAISFPEETDLLPSVFSPVCACQPPLEAQPVASLKGGGVGRGHAPWRHPSEVPAPSLLPLERAGRGEWRFLGLEGRRARELTRGRGWCGPRGCTGVRDGWQRQSPFLFSSTPDLWQ